MLGGKEIQFGRLDYIWLVAPRVPPSVEDYRVVSVGRASLFLLFFSLSKMLLFEVEL